jgi:hypothetical protein
MVTLRILDEEFDEKIENISLVCAFSMIEDYCFEHMIDEPKVSDILYDVDRMVVYLDNVTFEIEDCYEVETEIGKIDTEKGHKKPIMIQTKEEFENILNYEEEKTI